MDSSGVAANRQAPAQAGIVPELSVRRGRAAVEFYQAAFGAVEVYRVNGTDDKPDLAMVGANLREAFRTTT